MPKPFRTSWTASDSYTAALALSRVVNARQITDDWAEEIRAFDPDVTTIKSGLELQAIEAAGCDIGLVADMSVDHLTEFAAPVLAAHEANDIAELERLWQSHAPALTCASILEDDFIDLARRMQETGVMPECGARAQ